MQPGQILRLRYEIIEQIGSGGFGVTYKAKDIDIPQTPLCVVKHLQPKDPDPAVFAAAQELFVREAETLYELGKHDQIPALKAYFAENGNFFLVQELIEGHDLTKEIIFGQPWSEAQTIKLLKEILEVLNVIHQQNIIHRDVKPANIMRRQRDGLIVLIDFGAVKQLTTLSANPTTGQTSFTKAISSPGYTPFEQYMGKPKLSSDLYALGMLAIQALTGLPPAQLPEDFQDNRELWHQKVPNLSDKLKSFIDKISHNTQGKRYQNAGEALVALNEIYPDQKPPQSPPPTVIPTLINPVTDPLSLNLGQGVILELVKIPAGSFLMGGDHQITLKSFYLGKYPVTQKQYQQVMGKNPSYFKGDNNPVECISWYDAVKFCEKVSQITKKEVRLPSETQWEYAARAGTTTDYFFGDDSSQLGEYAWYDENRGKTHPVGDNKKPNPWGIYDLLGNVWEWCGDDWHGDYKQLPQDGICLNIKHNSIKKLLRHCSVRGGSWFSDANDCRCGLRYWDLAGSRLKIIGCRVVVVPSTL